MKRTFTERPIDRRELLKLLAVGGVVSSSALTAGCATSGSAVTPRAATSASAPTLRSAAHEPFTFLQVSDTHWGYQGDSNPFADVTLPRAISAINASVVRPDFVIFTGDLTQRTDDDALRRKRLKEFRSRVAELDVPTRYFIPGEHDAAPDAGAAYREEFGQAELAFDHKGVHFVLLDNVSAPGAVLGEAQLDWLARDLQPLPAETPVVVVAHRPLFDLLPSWDWTTRDGGRALQLLQRFRSVTVFYGHIHQEHHHVTGRIQHHAARSLIFPLPAPGSVPNKAPLAWDASASDHGLGYRSVELRGDEANVSEVPLLAEVLEANRG